MRVKNSLIKQPHNVQLRCQQSTEHMNMWNISVLQLQTKAHKFEIDEENTHEETRREEEKEKKYKFRVNKSRLTTTATQNSTIFRSFYMYFICRTTHRSIGWMIIQANFVYNRKMKQHTSELNVCVAYVLCVQEFCDRTNYFYFVVFWNEAIWMILANT